MSEPGYNPASCAFGKTKFRPLANFTGGVNMQVKMPANMPARINNLLIPGNHLIGNPYNGLTKETWEVDAISENVPNRIVTRDEHGGFSAETVNVSSLEIDGEVVLEQDLEVQGTLNLGTDDHIIVIRGNLIADQETTLKGDTKLNGKLMVMDKTVLHHDLDANRNVQLSAPEYETTVRGNLVVKQTVQMEGNVYLNETLHVTKGITTKGRFEAKDEVLLGTTENPTEIRGAATVMGNVRALSSMFVDGNVHIDANLSVNGNVDMHGPLVSHNTVHLGSESDTTTIVGPCLLRGNLVAQAPISIQAPVHVQKKQVHEDDVYLQTNFLYGSAADNHELLQDYLVAHRTPTRNCPGVWKFAHESLSNTNGQSGTSLLDCGGIQTTNPDCENFLAGDLTVAGNLLVTGNTISVETEILQVTDPILTLGIDANILDYKDRGVEFRYFDTDTNSIQRGFFGWQRSNDRFVFFKSATRTDDTFTGTLGDVQTNDIHVENLFAKQVRLQDDIAERTNHHIFYSSDGERVFPNTREGIQASMGLIPSTSSKPDRLILRDASGDFEARHAKLDGLFVGETHVIDADGRIEFDRLKNVPSLTVGQKASSEEIGSVSYTGHERTPGSFYGGTVSPDSDMRLNYDGNLHATRLFDGGIRVVTESRRILVQEGLDYAGETITRGGVLDHDLNLRVDDTVVRTNGGTYTLTHGNLSFEGNGETRATGTSDASPFVIQTNDIDRIVISPSGHVGLGENPTPSEDHALKVDGSIFATQNVFGFSDERYKKDICIIDNALESVRHIDGVRFRWKDMDDQSVNLGLLAQNVESVFPEVVTTDVNTGRKGVAYASLVPVLVQCIKELVHRTERLESELRSLSR